jgi:L-alanine-DL-glutamate epimerase-like enolase superfamily enzyme
MHFVAATPNMSYACELGEFARLLDDPAEGLEVEGGMLRVPTGMGLGVALRPAVSAAARG